MSTLTFTTWTNDSPESPKMIPSPATVYKVLEMANPKHRNGNHIIIARYRWLRYNELPMPEDLELPNLCITIKNGKPLRAFYDNRLSHIIKKQKYTIQILN
jgi:hypothetical protein